MRLFETIIAANHRAVAGDTSTGLHPAEFADALPVKVLVLRRQSVTNRHRLKTGCCRVSQPVTNCNRLKMSPNPRKFIPSP